RLLFFHTVDLDFLDDHIATTDRGNDGPSLDASGGERIARSLGDNAGVHHFALDDGVREQRCDCDLRQLRLALRVINDGDFDEARSDIEPDRSLFATEETHGESVR